MGSFEELFNMSKARLSLESKCETGESSTMVCGMVGWFDLFCCTKHRDVVLATGPDSPLTHWVQCWMPFEHQLKPPVEVDVGLRLASDYSGPGLIELVTEVQVCAQGKSSQAS